MSLFATIYKDASKIRKHVSSVLVQQFLWRRISNSKIDLTSNRQILSFIRYYQMDNDIVLIYPSTFIFFYFFFKFFYLWWILSYIEMKQPRVYMCSPSQSPLPPPSPPIPSRFSQCTRSERLSHASNLGW